MRAICPNCGKEYNTILERPVGDKRCIQDIFPDAQPWEREQLITGICSNKCWDEFLSGLPSFPKYCKCGSGLERYSLYDARGIFCGYVCDECEDRFRAKFRADIFTDPQYETSEDIDEY